MQRDLWNVRPRASLTSLRFNVGCADNFAPFLRFVGDELAEIGGRTCEHCCAEIVDKLNMEINAALADPKMKVRLADLGEALPGSPADFGKLIADETEKWGNVIRALNIKAD